jgi:hypothetical protein
LFSSISFCFKFFDDECNPCLSTRGQLCDYEDDDA